MNSSFLPPSETMAAIAKTAEAKLSYPLSKSIILGIIAGAYIALGAHFFTTVVGNGLPKLIGGGAFSLGLMMVLIAGGELFTGNTMLVISRLQQSTSIFSILKNWLTIYTANLMGALCVAALIFYSGLNGSSDTISPVGKTAVAIAEAKSTLPFIQVFIRAVLANWLVCIAVIFAASARDIVSKIFAILVPITAFVAMGFEHSIANMYFLPAGMLLSSNISGSGILNNILASTAGNVIGAVVFVWIAYWYVYLQTESHLVTKSELNTHHLLQLKKQTVS